MVQRIEALVGLKLELFPSEQEAVLVLAERVSEAQRIATMQMKEADSKRKGGGGSGGKRKGAADDGEDPALGKAFRRKQY
jgi:ATP-dependent RNA helicase DDX47/RRP3